MKKLISILLVLSLCFGFTACNINITPPDNESNEPSLEGEEPEVIEIGTVKDSSGLNHSIKGPTCTARANTNMRTEYSAFKDDTYNYYVFYLGRIYNAALDNGNRQYYDGAIDTNIKFSVTNSEESEIRKTTNKVATDSTTRNYSLSEHADYSYEKGGLFSEATHSVEVGISATQAWGFNNTTTISDTFESCSKNSTTTNNEITFEFTKDCPVGNYFYILLGDIDIYSAVIVDRNTKKFDVVQLSSIVRYGRQLLYLGEELEYEGALKEDFEFNISDVENAITTEPTTSLPGNTSDALKTYSTIMNKYSCGDLTDYNKAKPEPNSSWKSRHNGWELGHLELYGCSEIGNNYNVEKMESFAIRYKVNQDPSNLPRVGSSKTTLENDEATRVYGTNINSRVGYGAYWVRVTYEDDTQDQFNKTNIFKNASVGTVVTLIDSNDINTQKQIKSIDVVIVYELYAGGPGFMGIWWKETPNWRCEYTYSFI